MRRVLALLLLTLLPAAVPASAQIQYRPTDVPIVTAENESWYVNGEPIQFAGDLYYPAGATVFFNGNSMVRSGHFNGVPLYTDTTLEPFSIVGTYDGFPVFARNGSSEQVIYMPTREGVVAPYRLKQ